MPVRPSIRRSSLLVGLAVAATGLVATPLTATAVSTTLVINEVYVNGGSTGATWTHKYVEIHNKSASAIDLAGTSIQYRSPTGSGASSTAVPLTGTVPAGGYFTVQGGSNGSNGSAVPGVDQVAGGLNPGAGGGTITLASVPTAVDPSTTTNIIDKVGWGTSNAPEGTAATGNSVTKSLSRSATSVDTDVNSADFTATDGGTPDAVNTTVVVPPVDPPDAGDKTIAEIQGTGAESPLKGSTATTTGVVTAAFPTGGFNGFYIQTGGPDTTPGASDGIFVYEPGFSGIEVGDSVEVSGEVKEFSGLTEIDATTVTELTEALPPAVPNTEIPGTDCALPGTDCPTAAELDAEREELEGEAFLPTAPMTVTDSYDFGVTSSSFFGEIGIAAGSTIPLVTPTEVVDAQDTAGVAARTAYNDAHRVVLDDGSSTNYWNTANTAAGQDSPLPWLTADHTVRVGAAVTFDEPVVLDYRFGWKLQPQRQVVGVPTGLVTFEQDRPAAPAPVGGDLKLATFNVLNYFTTLGGDVDGCTAYVDRDDNPIATRSCSGSNGPRGAWDQPNFERQQAKIVKAINTMDADIVSLEELENSRTVDGTSRDEAIGALVAALNAAAGGQRWAFVPSPAVLPASEDVIRNGFIYDPSSVELVGESELLDVPAFDNAREPLAQVFKAKGGADVQKFAVIVNHFKSKGSGVDDGTGQGNANPDRVAQAKALTAFASTFSAARGTDKVFLTGDFNAYSMEDPVQEIEAAGYQSLKSTDDPDEETYSFAGTSGSLDHVFANAAAKAMVTGVDVWETNANESVYYQYSRYNYVGTDLYRPDVFAASDHNPEVVGIKLPAVDPGTPAPTVEATVTPQRVVVDRTRAMAHVKVTADGKPVATGGTVEVREGSTVLASAPAGNGVVNLKLPVFETVGEHTLTVRYVAGSGAVTEKAVVVDVLKAASDARAKATAKAGKATVVKVRVGAQGEKATGKVKVSVKGKPATATKVRLKGGKATVRLPGLRPGRYTVVVRYLGDDETKRSRELVKLRVRR
ncbi:ExeM/NucH family extracellular endonuclease [Nocardioides sediminis]|uniref:ExeM/NucH family extracellular endonuclease n=1 Tax=Nocardioides sediminis TaxID=433648 RepID=UPI000D31D73C|nr:ExeM/NucH family extracellular endonuclease [Nocardioides sediminis]